MGRSFARAVGMLLAAFSVLVGCTKKEPISYEPTVMHQPSDAEKERNAAPPVAEQQPQQVVASDAGTPPPKFFGTRTDRACNRIMELIAQRYGTTYVCWPGAMLGANPDDVGMIVVTADGRTPITMLRIRFPADVDAIHDETQFEYSVQQVNSLVQRMQTLHDGLSPQEARAVRARLN